MQTLTPNASTIARLLPMPGRVRNAILDKALKSKGVKPVTTPEKHDRFIPFDDGSVAVYSAHGTTYDMTESDRGYNCGCDRFKFHRTCRHSEEFTSEVLARRELITAYPAATLGEATAFSVKPCAKCKRYIVTVLIWQKWADWQYGGTHKKSVVCGCGMKEANL